MDYLLFLQNIRTALSGSLDSFFLFLTRLAESPVSFLFLAWIYWCNDKQIGQIMALNTGISCAASQAIKGIARVDRPWIRDSRITPLPDALGTAPGYSFPSGHTIRAGGAYGSLGLELFYRKARRAGTGCLILLLLIAFSRNWVGVHTIEDVLAGLLLVIVNWFLIRKVLCWAELGGCRDVIVCVAGCILFSIPMIWLGCLSNCGACMGFFIGWLLERRFVHFENPVLMAEKIEKGLPGMLCVLLISTVFQHSLSTLMNSGYAGFFAGLFLALFIMVLYPAIISWNPGVKRTILIISTALVFLFPFGISLAKAEEPKTIAVIGHRGFAAAAPENTIPAFEKALAQDVDYIELDVQLSADRQIVVCHDSNLQRLTGLDTELSSLTLQELKQLDVGSWFSPEYAGTTIPTLSEVLELIRESEVKVYLELKDIGEDSQYPLDVYLLTEQYQMSDRCVFASFQYEYLKTIKAAYPEAGILLNTMNAELTIPEVYPSDYYGIYYPSFSKELAQAIHQHESIAFVWTVDDPEQMKDAIEKGTDGICSNNPDRVQTYLRTAQ